MFKSLMFPFHPSVVPHSRIIAEDPQLHSLMDIMTAHWGHLLQPEQPAPAPVIEPSLALELPLPPRDVPRGENEVAPVVANRGAQHAAQRAVLEQEREAILKLGVYYLRLCF